MSSQMMPSTLEIQRLGRFLAVGVLNTAFGYVVFAILVLATMPAQPALLLATASGVAFNYFSTGRLVFADAESSDFSWFVLVYGASYLFNAVALHQLIALGLSPLFSQLILLPIVAIATYVALRCIVFRGKRL